MKYLFLSQKWVSLVGMTWEDFKYNHGSLTRNVLLAHHMALLDDTEVFFQSSDKEPPVHPFKFKWWDGKDRDFDAVISIQALPLADNPEWKTHPLIIMLGDMPSESCVRVHFVDSPKVLQKTTEMEKEKENLFKTTLPGIWGVTDWPAVPNPYPNPSRKVAFYSGLVYYRQELTFLNDLADKDAGFDVWATILFGRDIVGGEHHRGLTDTERATLVSPRLHLVSDFIPNASKEHGPVRHGIFSGFIQHAHVGLCPARIPAMAATHCKVYDYLGNGLPVVIDERVVDSANVDALSVGTVYKEGGALDAIKAELALNRDKAEIKRKAIDRWGWDVVARHIDGTARRMRPIDKPPVDSWTKGLKTELDYWGWALRQPDKGEMQRRDIPNRVFDPFVAGLAPTTPDGPFRVLDVGCGPLSPLGMKAEGLTVELTAIDPLADEYAALLDRNGVQRDLPMFPKKGRAEDIVAMFGKGRFDVVVAFNSLDHMENPTGALRQMALATKPGGAVYVWCYRNEGDFEKYIGLHQWNLDLQDDVPVLRGKTGAGIPIGDIVKDLFCTVERTWKGNSSGKDTVHFILRKGQEPT